MMFPSELRAFHAVAQSGSIRKAAELPNVAPSSVSRKIVLLEQQIGTALLERASKGVALTHAGVMVAEYARSVVLDYDSLSADLNDARGSRHRLVRLHTVESIVSGGSIDAAADFRKNFDTVSFPISVVPAPQVVTDVQRGDCEAGLTFGQPPQPGSTGVRRPECASGAFPAPGARAISPGAMACSIPGVGIRSAAQSLIAPPCLHWQRWRSACTSPTLTCYRRNRWSSTTHPMTSSSERSNRAPWHQSGFVARWIRRGWVTSGSIRLPKLCSSFRQ